MDDFVFQDALVNFFLANDGAGSRVTEREGMRSGDRSVTVSSQEKTILNQFHSNFPRMSLVRARANGEKTEFKFRQFPSGVEVKLSINHPKSKGDETRIYFRKGVFHPEPGDFWFIYERDGDIWIGSFASSDFDNAMQGKTLDEQNGFDQINEEAYQNVLNGRIPSQVKTTSVSYKRNPKVASLALDLCKFQCEMMPDMATFTSKATGNPFLEAHHFIPMFEQRSYSDNNLDVVKNICILNPYAHRMLHHATYSEIEPYVKKLAEPREALLNDLGLTVDRVLKIYGGP